MGEGESEMYQIGNVSLQDFLILLGFFFHTLSCMLVIVAIHYCPKWYYPGWIALVISTILVFLRRAGWAYSMIAYGAQRKFFMWEYVIYCLISIGWGIAGLIMITRGRGNREGSTTTRSSSSRSSSSETTRSQTRDG
jgi:hypothetical protein